MYTLVTENCIKNEMGFGWHLVAVCGITPKQNCIVTFFFFFFTSNLDFTSTIICLLYSLKRDQP